MTPFERKILRLKSTLNETEEIILTATENFLKANEEFLEDLNVQQLQEGVNSKGEKLGKYRNSSYARFKNRLNPTAGLGNVDLILSGKYSKGIEAKVKAKALVFEGTDSKTAFIDNKYPDSRGLTTQSRAELTTVMLPFLQNTYKAELKESVR